MQYFLRFDFINLITEPTRVCTKFYKRLNNYKTTSTLIDLIITNNEFHKESMTVDCHFSDHKFVCSKFLFESMIYFYEEYRLYFYVS